MIDGPICIAIWINLLTWGTPLQPFSSFIFLGIGISKFIEDIR